MKTIMFITLSALLAGCQGELKEAKEISSSCKHNGVAYDCATGVSIAPTSQNTSEEVTERGAISLDITMTANSSIDIDHENQRFVVLEDDKVTTSTESIFSDEINSCAVSLKKNEIYDYAFEGESLVLEGEGGRLILQPLHPFEGTLTGVWGSQETTDEGVEIFRKITISYGGQLQVSRRCLHR
jgi:hypothetical protein